MSLPSPVPAEVPLDAEVVTVLTSPDELLGNPELLGDLYHYLLHDREGDTPGSHRFDIADVLHDIERYKRYILLAAPAVLVAYNMIPAEAKDRADEKINELIHLAQSILGIHAVDEHRRWLGSAGEAAQERRSHHLSPLAKHLMEEFGLTALTIILGKALLEYHERHTEPKLMRQWLANHGVNEADFDTYLTAIDARIAERIHADPELSRRVEEASRELSHRHDHTVSRKTLAIGALAYSQGYQVHQ